MPASIASGSARGTGYEQEAKTQGAHTMLEALGYTPIARGRQENWRPQLDVGPPAQGSTPLNVATIPRSSLQAATTRPLSFAASAGLPSYRCASKATGASHSSKRGFRKSLRLRYAGGGSRTHMPLGAEDFKSPASTVPPPRRLSDYALPLSCCPAAWRRG